MRRTGRRVIDQVSAGGVVSRLSPAGLEVVICGNLTRRTWTLPKGTPEPGEELVETALREVSEETGLEVRVVEELGTVDYWFAMHGARVHKYVHYWLMDAVGGDLALHDIEFDAVEWAPAAEAVRRLSYGTDRDMLRQAMTLRGVEA